VELSKSLVSKKLRIKAEFQLAALGSKFRFPAHLLRRRFESAQTANLLHDPFGIELVFQPFEGSVDRLTFSHNYFGHKNSILLNASLLWAVNSSRGSSERQSIKRKSFGPAGRKDRAESTEQMNCGLRISHCGFHASILIQSAFRNPQFHLLRALCFPLCALERPGKETCVLNPAQHQYCR
jgi:hypothetical protein